jgi:long-chain acyl-CoA synthetase
VAHDTIPLRLMNQAKIRPNDPAYFVKQAGFWRGTSWSEYAAEVRTAAKAMIALGVQKGQNVAILGFNRPEWVIFDVAAMAVGGAGAGIYTTCSPSEVQYIVHHCEAPLIIVENADQWKKIEQQRANLPLLKHVVMMKGAPTIQDPMVLSWDAFMQKAASVKDEDFWARMDALEPQGLATLIYTSGTTGPPKGVMLSHRNLTWTADVARDITRLRPRDTNLSYLPLSHIAEQMFTVHGPISNGNAVYFAESIEAVPENLKEVQPSIMFGVPRIWEKFHAGISAKLADAKGAKKQLVDWARTIATRVNHLKNEGREPPFELAMQYELAKKLVFSKLKAAIGLGNARICVSGAAPISKEVIEFFASLDIVILEVYGQSEDTGPTSFNQTGRCRPGSVGPKIPGIDVKIGDDGEILVRGPHVFLGYYKEPEATKETLIDGWLHSGDLGEFDRDGFLFITGRKKEIIITAGGKNIAPKNIEGAIKNDELVAEAVVIGDRRKFLSVLITVDEAAVQRLGIHEKPHESAKVRDLLQRRIDEVNRDLARVEQVKKFYVLPRQFTIDAGELTPTLKIKRKKVAEIWSKEIEAMYAEEAGASALN